jgi:hypothetical protein
MEHRVSTFFFEYGLFAAKMITILAITFAAIAGCIILFSAKQQENLHQPKYQIQCLTLDLAKTLSTSPASPSKLNDTMKWPKP